jgi:hypothetical protein
VMTGQVGGKRESPGNSGGDEKTWKKFVILLVGGRWGISHHWASRCYFGLWLLESLQRRDADHAGVDGDKDSLPDHPAYQRLQINPLQQLEL